MVSGKSSRQTRSDPQLDSLRVSIKLADHELLQPVYEFNKKQS